MSQSQADPFAQFRWEVAGDGYEWIDTRWGVALTTRSGEQAAPRRYRPLARSKATLFRTFADLPRTQDAVIAFATEYGMLGVPLRRSLDLPDLPQSDEDLETAARVILDQPPSEAGFECFDRGPDEAEDQPGSGLHCWTFQIQLMAAFLKVAGQGRRSTAPDKIFEATLVRVFRRQQKQVGILKAFVNKMLRATCAPDLDWSRIPTRGRDFTLQWMPRSLLGALWLQAAMSVTDKKEFRKCKSCGHLMEISRAPTTGARADIRLCSDACRAREYRKRKQRAVGLAERGWSATRIAERFLADRGWSAKALAERGWSKAKVAKKRRDETQTVRGWLKTKE